MKELLVLLTDLQVEDAVRRLEFASDLVLHGWAQRSSQRMGSSSWTLARYPSTTCYCAEGAVHQAVTVMGEMLGVDARTYTSSRHLLRMHVQRVLRDTKKVEIPLHKWNDSLTLTPDSRRKVAQLLWDSARYVEKFRTLL